MSACKHPEEQRFAWTYYDAAEQGDYLAQGCTACGAVLTGGFEMRECVATPVGAQHRLSPKLKKKRKSKKEEGA